MIAEMRNDNSVLLSTLTKKHKETYIFPYLGNDTIFDRARIKCNKKNIKNLNLPKVKSQLDLLSESLYNRTKITNMRNLMIFKSLRLLHKEKMKEGKKMNVINNLDSIKKQLANLKIKLLTPEEKMHNSSSESIIINKRNNQQELPPNKHNLSDRIRILNQNKVNLNINSSVDSIHFFQSNKNKSKNRNVEYNQRNIRSVDLNKSLLPPLRIKLRHSIIFPPRELKKNKSKFK